MLKHYSKIVFVGMLLFVAMSGSVQAAPAWWPIVPCGLNSQPEGATQMDTLPDGTKVPHDFTQDCNQCDVILLFKNLIDLVTYGLVPVLGTFFFILGGFYILIGGSTGNPGKVEEGKKLMKETAYGIAIILSSWLITNMILKSVANEQIASTPWYQISCRVGNLKDITDASVPSVGTPPAGSQKYSCNSNNQCVVTANGQYTSSSCDNKCQAVVPPPSSGVACLQSGLNLCQGDTSVGCANSKCSQYASMIERQANGVATVNILKAFMEVESSCNIESVTGTSYGLMQMTPPIPQIYASFCGVRAGDVNRAWLTNPANAEKSICISAQWINSLAASQCGSSVRNLYAGYNGGQNGACALSVSCAGETSCSGEPVKRWECLYNDTAHQSCNGGTNIMLGYNQTRQGATRIMYCAANPGF